MKRIMLFALYIVFAYAGCIGPEEPGPSPYAPLLLAELQVWHGLAAHRYRPYDSRDPVVIIRQIEQAEALGIGGFVVDWYGPACGAANDEERSFQDGATAALLLQAATRGFKIALLYDEGTIRSAETDPARYQSRAESDLSAAVDYFSSPAYLRLADKPAVFVFPYDNVDREIRWDEVRRSLGVPIALIDKDPNPVDPTPHDSWFDGFFAWVTATNGGWRDDGEERGETYLNWFYPTMKSPPYSDKIMVGGVWPGFDDTLAFWRDPASIRYMSRRGTDTYDWSMALARRNEAPCIMIETWNDFEEGTDVEFGVGMTVDMDDKAAERLIRSSPLRVTWRADHPHPELQVYKNGVLLPTKIYTAGTYIGLLSEAIYDLKLWADDLPTPILRQVVIRHQDPVPGVTPVVVDP